MELFNEIPSKESSGVIVTKGGGLDINILNPEPQLMLIHNCIDEYTANILMELVDERGKQAQYQGNPHCLEYRMNMDATGDDKESVAVRRLHKVYYPIQNLIPQVFKHNAMDFLTGHAGFWILRYDEGGEFENHVDWSMDIDRTDKKYAHKIMSTLVIHLNEGDFEGGELSVAGKVMDIPKYSGEVHDGWTYHRVAPVTHGSRYVILAHFLGVLKD